MKGFEISINDAAPILAASDDIVTIIISIGYSNGNYMHVGGMVLPIIILSGSGNNLK